MGGTAPPHMPLLASLSRASGHVKKNLFGSSYIIVVC
jgi:hypothetical protein